MSLEERNKVKELKRKAIIKKTKGKFRDGSDEKLRFISGIYELDKKAYSGFPRGRLIEFFGAEGSGKSVNAVIISANINRYNHDTGEIDPSYENPCSVWYGDLEDASTRSFEEPWGFFRNKYGNNVDYVCGGDVLCDNITDMINDDLYQLYVVDSTDKCYPQEILEGEYDKNDMGKKGKCLARTCRKWQSALAEAAYRNRDTPWRIPSIIFISHATPIFADPYGRWESEAGSKVKFYSSVRVYFSKNKVNKEDSADFGITKITATFRKNKLNPPGTVANYFLGTGEGNMELGQINNINPIFKDARDFDLITEVKKGYSLYGEVYKTQKAIKDKMAEDPLFLAKMWQDCNNLIAGGVVELEVDVTQTDDYIEKERKGTLGIAQDSEI